MKRQDGLVPEGDTVWNTARVLADAIEGQVLTRSDFRVPQLATVDLQGWLVAESASYGKHLLLRLTREPDRAMTLHSHLRMDGTWRTYQPGERWTGRPAHLIRVALHAPASVAVGFHLHVLAIVPTAEEHRLIGHLGPDLMGEGWDPAEAVARLAARPDRPIADALLDQRNLAGIGNLYKAEVLFLRGVNPWTATAPSVNAISAAVPHSSVRSGCLNRWTPCTSAAPPRFARIAP